jgi:large subunit ribosomal protein L30e
MAKSKIIDINEEIKKLVATPKAIVGTQKTLKGLRAGKITRVFLAKNVKATTVSDIESYAKVASVEIVKLELGNDELGTICKKPFSISVLGELK